MHPTSLDASFDKLLTVPFLLLLAGLGVLCLSAPLRVLAGKKGAVYVVTDRRVLLLFDGWDDRLDQGEFLEFEPSDFEVGRVFHHRDDATSIRLKRQADWFSRKTCYPLGLYGVKDGAGAISAIGKLMQLCWKPVW